MTTASENVCYTAYDQLMLMHDERGKYVIESEHDEAEDYESFATEEEAAQWIKDHLKQLTEDDDLYKVIPTRHGLDSVEFHDLIILREVYDENYEDWDVDSDFESKHSTTTLPDDVLASAEVLLKSRTITLATRRALACSGQPRARPQQRPPFFSRKD